ncbi:hypothetical protein [Pseudomonas sp. HN8-3]|uniref:hypothetical protein n=1 Tax=Pseudomonas sp. HN8-3 TaxID=2886361 RepID=UPI001E5B58C3|nr:hypothetical protein [Pseudomonas sp. HN8-3]UEH06699.1 hypothetical protein LJX92_17250 [Pseudomonas sp. HN8-3]
MNRHELNRAMLQALVLLVFTGQATASDQIISVQHDRARGATCWILNNTGISCLPDSSLPQKPANSTIDEAQEASPVQAKSMCRNDQLPSAQLLLDEKFQL